MLQKKTVEKLEELVENLKNLKIKKLLVDAITNWQRSDCTPLQGDFGVYPDKDSFYKVCEDERACLIGAALIGKQGGGSQITDAGEAYNLSDGEICAIINIFDRSPNVKFYTKWEYYDLISEFRDIVEKDVNFEL